jgi:diadenylate cyclase
MSERSDAVVLVVSEETGALSIAFEGQLYYALSLAEIQQKLVALVDKDTRTAAAGEMNDISDHAAAALDQGQSTAKTNEVSFFD